MTMKVYCAGPIRGDRSYAPYFQKIVQLIQKMGHIPLTELTLQPGEDFTASTDDKGIYQRDRGWLDQAQALVAEVSAPSLGVGYEISYALNMRKIPVLCLRHRSSGALSAMISGNSSGLLTLETYATKEELKEKIRAFIEKCV
jgi:hypothetical protein